MAKHASDLEFMLSYDQTDVIAEFIEHVANKGLATYKNIIQWGKKEGESLYVHALNGVFILEKLRGLLDLSEIEMRIMCVAYPIHDLNKSQTNNKSFNQIATTGTVQDEINRIGADIFFPNYQEYLEEITLLIRSHSGHYHTSTEWLIRGHLTYKLSRERLSMLRNVMKALDELDLSTSFDERSHKDGFISLINAHIDEQFEFVFHKINEQRGLLTNIIHNQVKIYLEENFQLTPLLYYPEGIFYLSHKKFKDKLKTVDLKEVGHNVVARVDVMKREEFSKFIKSGNQGIKVDEACLQLEIPIEEIFNVIISTILSKSNAKAFKIKETEDKCRERLQDAKTKVNSLSIQHYLEKSNICPITQEGMGTGELLRTYYIFINAHYKSKIKNSWQHLYNIFKISQDQIDVYECLDPLYHRAFVMAHDLQLSLDSIYEIMCKDSTFFDDGASQSRDKNNSNHALEEYVVDNIQISGLSKTSKPFESALSEYVANNHQQCAMCGSSYKTDFLRKINVPASVGVQSFSNRLMGGIAKEPVRKVCEICQTQLIISKLSHSISSTAKTLYLHLFPYSYFTGAFLVSLQTQIKNILNQDITSIFPKTDEIFRSFIVSEGKDIKLFVSTHNSQGKPYSLGFPLPLNYSEAIGNTMSFPLNCPGQNDTAQFLFALQMGLVLGRFLGCKVLLSESSIPILGKNDFGSLYIDNVPLAFSGWLPCNNLNFGDLGGYNQPGTLWTDIVSLSILKNLLYYQNAKQDTTLDPMLILIKALNHDQRFDIFHTVDRLLENKIRNGGNKKPDKDWESTNLIKKCLPEIIKLISKNKDGGVKMKQLKSLAEIGWQNKIKGRSLERTSLMKPFNMLIEGLERRSDIFGLDTLRAQMVEDIFRHIEVITPKEYEVGKNKREQVKKYVDMFFDGVLGEAYRNNSNKLLSDIKPLRSAYLFYVTEQIPSK